PPGFVKVCSGCRTSNGPNHSPSRSVCRWSLPRRQGPWGLLASDARLKKEKRPKRQATQFWGGHAGRPTCPPSASFGVRGGRGGGGSGWAKCWGGLLCGRGHSGVNG